MSLPISSSAFNANSRFNPQPQTLQPEKPRSSYFVRHLILVLVILFVMVMVINSIAWLILHPRCPIIRVNSLYVSNGTQFTPYYDIELNIKNPNKKIDMLIDPFNITVLHRKTPLSRTWMSPFYVGKINQTNIEAKLGRDVGNSMHGRGFENTSEVWSTGRVTFYVVMDIRTTFRSWNWLTKKTLMGVLCRNLIVQLSAKGAGKLIGRGNDCSVFFR